MHETLKEPSISEGNLFEEKTSDERKASSSEIDKRPEIDKKLWIRCPRFGGTRFAYSCAHYDRYRGCRRSCKSLKAVIEGEEGFTDNVQKTFEGKSSLLTSKQSCKGLPANPLSCVYCDFTGKSERGLAIHLKRSHGICAPR